jgi:transposase
MSQDMASRLFALDGAEVAEVDEEPGGARTVWLVTADPGARVCPACKAASEHVREQVVTRPADIGYGWDQVSVVWVKRRWECRVASCPRGTFTGSLPAVLPRCRVTERLRDHAGRLVAEGGRTVAQAARECGLSWPVTHQAFAASADPLLEQPPALVAHLGSMSTGVAGPGGGPMR